MSGRLAGITAAVVAMGCVVLLDPSATAPARATGITIAAPSPPVLDLLSGMDYVPPRAMLDEVLGPDPVTALVAVASDGTVDPGVRLRAYRALREYPEDAARAELIAAIGRHQKLETLADHAALRAAIEALAVIGGPDAVPIIAVVLSEERDPDLRVAAARALETTRSTTALRYLEEWAPNEDNEYVFLEIQKAMRTLRDLGEQ